MAFTVRAMTIVLPLLHTPRVRDVVKYLQILGRE